MKVLASVDETHETLSGPATRRILEREFTVFGQKGHERLAKISVAHLQPEGSPGYLRVDTVFSEGGRLRAGGGCISG